MNVGIKGVLHRIMYILKTMLAKVYKSNKIEARSGAIENYNNCTVSHPINEEKDTIKNMVHWVNVSRVFRKNTGKSG